MHVGKASVALPVAAVLLLIIIACSPGQAALISGSTSLCQCTPRNVTTSSYLDSLTSYTADMVSLLAEITTQLTSLGLKYSDFSSSTLARLLQISGSAAEATKVANALLASLTSSSSGNGTSTSTAPICPVNDSLTFFGSSVYEALGSGGTYNGDKWTVSLSGGTLTVDYGVKSCTSQTQYIQQICVNGHPSQVYIFTQATSASPASLVTDSLTTSSETGSICIPIAQNVMAFTVLPRSLKTSASLMPYYQFTLTVTGCFTAIPAACTPTVAPTTTIPCTFGNALSEVSLLPANFFYNAKLSRIDGFVINATVNRTASATFLADLTADGCRSMPIVTQVCAAGNFKRMKIGTLEDYQGTIWEFEGSENRTATSIYRRFCYDVNDKVAILAIQPEELFVETDTQFKFFPEARGCYNPVSNSCIARPACVGPLEVGWHSDQLPQQSLTAFAMAYTGGQWVTTGADAKLTVDLSAGGCRKTAAVTMVCVTSTNASIVSLSAQFPVGDSVFNSSNNLTGSSPPSAASPWCQSYSAAPTMGTLYISFPVSTAPVNFKWTITGCFSSLPAYCLTTTAAPVSTVATTTVRPAEACSTGFPTVTNSDANLPATAISGGSYVAASTSWTVAKGSSLTFDLTVGSCRQSARLLAICILGNAATVRVDYVQEDNTRLVLANSTTESQPAAGAALCFTFPSVVYAKSLVLLPTALKTASAGDAEYSLMVNLSACYSAISSSCYNPVCGCTTNYRPVFYSKKYYRMSFKIVSGFYSVYKSTYATPITTDYQDLLNMTDTMIWLNFGAYKDKYEGIDQVTFTSGSVLLAARLIMYDGGYSASALEEALTAGMSGYSAGGTFVVNTSSIVITDWDTNSTTTTVAPLSASTVDLALLLGLLIPLIILFIVFIVLLVLLCKYCKCCCFAKTDSVHAGVRTSMQEAGTAMSTADLIGPPEKPEPQPHSAREDLYQYSGGGASAQTGPTNKPGDEPLPMPRHPNLQEQQLQQEHEREQRRRRKKKSKSAVTPLAASADDQGAAAAAGAQSGTDSEVANFMAGAQPLHFDRRPSVQRPHTPKTVSIETFTYQLKQPQQQAHQDNKSD